MDRGSDAVPYGERASEGGPESVSDPGEEVQQGQEAHQGLPAEVHFLRWTESTLTTSPET